MSRFPLVLFLAFAAWTTVAVSLHYFSASPWGGPLVLRPDRLLPDTLFIEWGLLALGCLLAGAAEVPLKGPRVRTAWRAMVLALMVVYCAFGQVDREVVRWLGQHMNLSYVRNFAGARDGQLFGRILSGDLVWTGAAVALIAALPLVAVWVWWRAGRTTEQVGRRTLMVAIVFMLATVTAHQWFRPSEKRWRRIRPAVIVIAHEAALEVLGVEKPRDSDRSLADLVSLARTGRVADAPHVGPHPAYPLWRDDNVGSLTAEDHRALPLSERPDVVFIVFETMRGWSTGLVPHPELEEGTPLVNAILREEALVFPYMHSVGFPSVEGCMGMHLGTWSHFRKIFFSEYLHIASKGFPEIFREFGYRTHALLGADPSFSNFTPWLERWYGEWEYDPAVHHDGPLVDRFIARWEETRGDTPRLSMIWTATTHPPYDVPASEGIAIAGDNESRFRQAIRYSDRQVARLLEHLRAHPDWSRTVVVIVGDHAQPTPEQWLMSDRIGNLTPGHTWTNFAVLGGWKGLPGKGWYTEDVSHLDLAPTLLSLLNMKAGNHFMGRDLTRVLANPDPTWPTIAFRYGDIAWQQGSRRINFRVDSESVIGVSFDRTDALQYGSLPGASWRTETSAPADWPVERWRDAARQFGLLLDEDRLMPRSEAAGGR